MKFCPECGTPCEGANFCPGCGKDLRPYNHQAQATQASVPKKPPMVTGQAKPVVQYDIETALAPFICRARGDEAYMITGVKDKNITKAVIPNCVTVLGTKAFWECPQLKEVYLPGSLNDSGYLAFGKCHSLKRVVIETGVQAIDEASFGHCEALTDVQLPEGLLEIRSWAFLCCGFESIQLPSSLVSIGDKAFQGCPNLRSIVIPSHVQTIGGDDGDGDDRRVFGNCPNLQTIHAPRHLVGRIKTQCDPSCTVIPY